MAIYLCYDAIYHKSFPDRAVFSIPWRYDADDEHIKSSYLSQLQDVYSSNEVTYSNILTSYAYWVFNFDIPNDEMSHIFKEFTFGLMAFIHSINRYSLTDVLAITKLFIMRNVSLFDTMAIMLPARIFTIK